MFKKIHLAFFDDDNKEPSMGVRKLREDVEVDDDATWPNALASYEDSARPSDQFDFRQFALASSLEMPFQEADSLDLRPSQNQPRHKYV